MRERNERDKMRERTKKENEERGEKREKGLKRTFFIRKYLNIEASIYR